MLGQLLNRGLRMVAVAMKKIDCATFPSTEEYGDDKRLELFKKLVKHDLQLLGFFGMEDSIRPGIEAIVQEARKYRNIF